MSKVFGPQKKTFWAGLSGFQTPILTRYPDDFGRLGKGMSTIPFDHDPTVTRWSRILTLKNFYIFFLEMVHTKPYLRSGGKNRNMPVAMDMLTHKMILFTV